MKTANAIPIIIALILGLTFTSCFKENLPCLKGEGVKETFILDLDPIHAFNIFGSADITIIEGDEQRIEITTFENILEELEEESYVSNGVWHVGLDKCVRNSADLQIRATIPYLTGIEISGSSDVRTEGTFNNIDDLELLISGSGDIDMDLGDDLNFIKTKISGSGDIDLRGSVVEQDININGSGEYHCKYLKSQVCDIFISGSGDCEVFVEDTLSVRVSGSGDVCYRGNPNLSSNVTGSGDVETCN